MKKGIPELNFKRPKLSKVGVLLALVNLCSKQIKVYVHHGNQRDRPSNQLVETQIQIYITK